MPDKNEDNLNPGQIHYEMDVEFKPSGTGLNENSDESVESNKSRQSDSVDDLRNAEENPDSPYINNYTAEKEVLEKGQKKQINRGKALIKIAQKKGPLTAIILSLAGGGILIGALLSPSLLLIQFKESLVNKLNTQLTSMDIRTTKVLTKKMNTLNGICTPVVNIKCKYSTMSKNQIKKFEKAGITIAFDPNTPKSILDLGRQKPKGFTFEGKTILANGLNTEIATNAKFRTALKRAYNPLYSGFSDAIWSKAASRLKINKAPTTFEGDDYESKMANLEDDLQAANKMTKQPTLTTNDIDPETGTNYEADSDALKNANENVNAFNELVDSAGGDGSTVSKILNGVSEATNAVKISGAADDVCTAYRTFRAIGYAAKTVRVMQLASFSMLFLNLADQIKAGDANPDDVSFLGTILTNTSSDDLGNQKSATDSYGYKYANYGDLNSNTISTMRYMAAAGVSGMMVNFFNSFPSGAKNGCRFLANPVVGFASVVGGLGLTFLSSGTSIFGKTAIKQIALEVLKSPGAWAGAGLGFAEIFLPGLLKDIVAGNTIDSSTVGANAGDAITSGASGIMGTTAKLGGNAPLTPAQAVAYNNLSKKVLAQYSEEDQLTSSQFDITNQNSFLGKLASMIMPYALNFSSFTGAINSTTSLAINSLSILNGSNVKAASEDEYSTCQDYEYRQLNLATDPLCNVIYGIPTEYLDIDPFDVIDELVADDAIYKEDIKIENVEHKAGDVIKGSNYEVFLKNCVNRTDPLGYNNSGTDGKECLIDENPMNKYYYLYQIDQRIQNGMDE